ncbi:unnamed protein product [Closterium sp. NIES-65]|nr:unnamed protein product [Closterium sp. NIES-65]
MDEELLLLQQQFQAAQEVKAAGVLARMPHCRPFLVPNTTQWQMDEELLLLQQQFQAAQEVKAATRLSERNVVELVSKLSAMGLLGDDLLYSLNGKEYITQERLQQEVEEEVRRRGRVSLVDLGTLLNVDLFYCERAAKNILENAKTQEQPWVQLVQGELITHDYWDGVADEVDAALQESGQVAVSDLAMRFNVGAELMASILSSRLGSRIHGTMSGGQLFTGAHMARMRAAVRGAARALTEAANMADIWPSVVRELGRDYGREYGDGTEVRRAGMDASAAAAGSGGAAAAAAAGGSGVGIGDGADAAAAAAAAAAGGSGKADAVGAAQVTGGGSKEESAGGAEAGGTGRGGVGAGGGGGGGGAGGKAEAVGAAEAALFARVFGECVAEGEVRGSSKGGGTGWVPEIFAQLQRQSVEAFFSQVSQVFYCSSPCLVICWRGRGGAAAAVGAGDIRPAAAAERRVLLFAERLHNLLRSASAGHPLDTAVPLVAVSQLEQYLESLFPDKSSAPLLHYTCPPSPHSYHFHAISTSPFTPPRLHNFLHYAARQLGIPHPQPRQYLESLFIIPLHSLPLLLAHPVSSRPFHEPLYPSERLHNVLRSAAAGHSPATALGIPQPRQYLESLFPDKSSALLLDSTLVHSSLVHQLDAAVEEAIAAKSWCDAATALPPALSPSDCAHLLQLCPVLLRAQKAAALAAASTAASGAGAVGEGQGLDGAEVYGDTCVVSSALLQAGGGVGGAAGATGAAGAEGQGLDGADVYGDTCVVSSALLQVASKEREKGVMTTRI